MVCCTASTMSSVKKRTSVMGCPSGHSTACMHKSQPSASPRQAKLTALAMSQQGKEKNCHSRHAPGQGRARQRSSACTGRSRRRPRRSTRRCGGGLRCWSRSGRTGGGSPPGPPTAPPCTAAGWCLPPPGQWQHQRLHCAGFLDVTAGNLPMCPAGLVDSDGVML